MMKSVVVLAIFTCILLQAATAFPALEREEGEYKLFDTCSLDYLHEMTRIASVRDTNTIAKLKRVGPGFIIHKEPLSIGNSE